MDWSLSAQRLPTDLKPAEVPADVELPLGLLAADIQFKSEETEY